MLFQETPQDFAGVPIQRELCEVPRGLVHTYIYTFWSFFTTDLGGDLQRLYTVGFQVTLQSSPYGEVFERDKEK